MIFDVLPASESIGCYLAHSLKTQSGRIAKGTLIDKTCLQHIQTSGITEVLVAQLGTTDIHEDAAALQIATALAGQGLTLSSPRTGRVNLHASVTGLCHFDRDRIISANLVDEGITIACIQENQWVPAGRMVATVKIIPYAVTQTAVETVCQSLPDNALSIYPPLPHKASLIQSMLPSMNENILSKTRRVTEQRLHHRGVSLLQETRCLHTLDALTKNLAQALLTPAHWILLIGASAISDRKDIIPQAITAAGGHIDRFGIPVDPGNLLLLGHIGKTIIIGLPGCARSPRYNGLDQILDRLVCQLPVNERWIGSLAIGGLLADNVDRPAPRVSEVSRSHVGALLLAAGSSRRAGSVNKLLYPIQETPMIGCVAAQLVKSRVKRTVAITGHEHEFVCNALAGYNIDNHYNELHDTGMASSVVAGVSQLHDMDALIVCLGDMPDVTSEIIDQLIAAFTNHPDKSIFIPTYQQQRGNPVLFGKVFFDTLLTLEGDKGGRYLCTQFPDKVMEVPVQSESVITDYDTLDALQSIETKTI